MAAPPLSDAELIERYVEPNPHKPGAAEARLREYGVAVWVLVDYWFNVRFDLPQVAQDFDLPPEAVQAALAYYRAHQALIDAQRLLHAS